MHLIPRLLLLFVALLPFESAAMAATPLALFNFIHKAYSLDDVANVSPYIKYGQKNQRELWPEYGNSAAEHNFTIDTIQIGCAVE